MAAAVDFDSDAYYEARIIALCSAEGQLLAGSLSDAWAARLATLLDLFEPQEHGAWCGYASTRIALRHCMRVAVPSQREMYDICTRDGSIKPGGSMAGGLSMAQLERIARLVALARGDLHLLSDVNGDSGAPELELVYGAANPASDVNGASGAPELELVYGADRAEFEARLVSDLDRSLEDGSVVLVNFLRSLGGTRGGHWSPIGGLSVPHGGGGEAYVLLLDVAAHRLGLHWVPLGLLVACCCTLNYYGTPRGYLRVAPRGTDNAGFARC